MSKMKFAFEDRQDLNLAIAKALSDEFEGSDKIAARMGIATSQILLPKKSYTLTSYLPTLKSLGLVEIEKQGGRSMYRRAQPVAKTPEANPEDFQGQVDGFKDESTRVDTSEEVVEKVPVVTFTELKEPPVIQHPEDEVRIPFKIEGSFDVNKVLAEKPKEAIQVDLSVLADAPVEDPFDTLVEWHKKELERLETMRAGIVRVRLELADIDKQEEALKKRRAEAEVRLAELLEAARGGTPVLVSNPKLTPEQVSEFRTELAKSPQTVVVAPAEQATLHRPPVVRNGTWLFRWVQAIANNLNVCNLNLPQSPFTFVPTKIKTKLAERIMGLRRDGASMTDLTEEQVKHVGITVVRQFEDAIIGKYGSSGYKATEFFEQTRR